MADFLTTFVPMLLFMLLPIWIPIIAVALGWIRDLIAGPSASAFGTKTAAVEPVHARLPVRQLAA